MRNDISDLLAFISQDELWLGRLQEVVAEHLMPALEEFNLDHDDLPGRLRWVKLPTAVYQCTCPDLHYVKKRGASAFAKALLRIVKKIISLPFGLNRAL